MGHFLIVTGGHLNIEFARDYVKALSYDKVFAVDKGLEYVDTLGLIPDYVIGDFDTVNSSILGKYEQMIQNCEIPTVLERHPVKKDATDTELAVEKAIQEGADSITILAGTGSRMDHVLANIGMLIYTAKKQILTYIVDETNRLQLLSADYRTTAFISREGQFGEYVSLLPMTPTVEGVNLKGALYPLERATLTQDSSLSISNQIQDELLIIQIQKGRLLVVESKDN